jgi:hypothetical protein
MNTRPGPEKKLRPKYVVRRITDEDARSMKEMPLPAGLMLSTDPEDIDSPFVLMPRKDPAAFRAMLTYVRCCEAELSSEILVWLRKIAASEPRYGSQGKRNQTAIMNMVISQASE